MQADQKVAKAQKAAADAAQLLEEEMSRLKRDLEFARKEKKGLVQRCLTTDHELASSLVGSAAPQHKQNIADKCPGMCLWLCNGLHHPHRVKLPLCHVSGISLVLILLHHWWKDITSADWHHVNSPKPVLCMDRWHRSGCSSS